MNPCSICSGFPGAADPAPLIFQSRTTDPGVPMENRREIYLCPECGRRWIREMYESGLGRFSESWSLPGPEIPG